MATPSKLVLAFIISSTLATIGQADAKGKAGDLNTYLKENRESKNNTIITNIKQDQALGEYILLKQKNITFLVDRIRKI